MKKYFKKYLPTHESIHQNRFIGLFGSSLQHHNLWHLNRRSVAGGVAIGMFTGLIPGPFQMISAALVSIIFKVNLPVAVFTTLYTNPFTIVPLYVVAYALGAIITGGGSVHMPAIPDLQVDHWDDWIPALFDWMMAMGKPFALGLFLLACLLALIGYFSVRWGWRIHVLWSLRKRALREK